METLGSRLKALRRQRNLTQQKIADALGVSKTSVIYWEKDENVPKHESLTALAKTLGTTTEWLLDGVAVPEKSNADIAKMEVGIYQAGDPVPDGYAD